MNKYFSDVKLLYSAKNFLDIRESYPNYEPMVKINAFFKFPLFYQAVQIGFVNAFVVCGLHVNFYFDNSKAFVFVDAHGVRVHEDAIDVSLCFMEISGYYHCPLVL